MVLFCCAAFSFDARMTQLPPAAAAAAAATAAALRRSISVGPRMRGGRGPRAVESLTRTAGAPGRAEGVAAGPRRAPGRTTPAICLGIESRRPRKAVEWAVEREPGWVAEEPAELGAPLTLSSGGIDTRQYRQVRELRLIERWHAGQRLVVFLVGNGKTCGHSGHLRVLGPTALWQFGQDLEPRETRFAPVLPLRRQYTHDWLVWLMDREQSGHRFVVFLVTNS